ncbi:MAG TPA: ATP-binding protein [Acidimicrobiales bacterium]|nr:ATP-binding protein [Acidimicrobiales bacterium]
MATRVTNPLGTSRNAELVEVSIPAQPELLSIPRLAAAAIAARAGFDLEEVEDLRLAIEELCLAAFEGRGPGRLHLRFGLRQHGLEVDCTFDPDGERPQPENARGEVAAGFTEQLLEALVDEHGTEVDGGTRRTWLRKSHPSPPVE